MEAAFALTSPAVAVGTLTNPANVGDKFGALKTNAAWTNAVDAAVVELLPTAGVGTITFPVNVGAIAGALVDTAAITNASEAIINAVRSVNSV